MTDRKIRILYTGGTFGMRPSDKGYVPAGDLAGMLEARLPELMAPSMPAFEFSAFQQPLDSANATPRHWSELAAAIQAESHRFDGTIVIHGSDTLAYSASALSFLLAGSDLPVIVTGSQIPLHDVRNDAGSNLIAAMQAIATGRLNEVAVCFGRRILRGNRSTKVHANELDAFASPNFPPLVEIGTGLRFAGTAPLPARSPALDGPLPDLGGHELAVLRVYPGIRAKLIDAVADSGTSGIILRCYGVGTGPTADRDFLAALRRACDAGIIITAVSQAAGGSVDLNTYAAGSALAEAGVLNGYDMTTEAALTKLHVLLAAGQPRAATTALMQQDLCGELTVSSGLTASG